MLYDPFLPSPPSMRLGLPPGGHWELGGELEVVQLQELGGLLAEVRMRVRLVSHTGLSSIT